MICDWREFKGNSSPALRKNIDFVDEKRVLLMQYSE